jgi:NAD(P)H-flavin reductase
MATASWRTGQPGAGEALGSDCDVSGRLDMAVLDDAEVPRDADYYLCGPEGFMRAIGAALTARGVQPEHVATEACDVPVGLGCRHGVCHNCESGLVAGAVTY